jgi:hypothetical protein
MITVYHLNTVPETRDLRDDMYYERDAVKKAAMCKALWARGNYEEVATVVVDDLNTAFRLTNHIDEAWTDTDDLRVSVKYRDARSTSVCDIMAKDGIFYFVDRGCGYTEMDLKAHG